ncbi:MAG: hybrid sensor histidine kinase/response regulator [Cytophagaceae bacterium]|nr:hybrid sensor histidine kinase/response regulator [Gemmatimonadaceae bacterium]
MRIATPEQLPDLLEPRGRRPRIAYAIGALAVVGLTVLRLELADTIGGGLPFLFYVLAVMIASWLGGWIPGIVTTLLCALVAAKYFLDPVDAMFPLSSVDRWRTLIFVVVGVLVSVLVEALHRARERLEVRTRDLQAEAAERRQVEGRLRDLGHRKDEFLAVLAHELRNPLAPIVSAAAMLEARQGDDPVVAHAARLIDRNAVQMVRLIDDLLDVARIERGTFELQRAQVDPRHVIDAAIEHCRPAIDEKGQHLSVKVPPVPLTVAADAMRLVQGVTNLLGNAVSYTPAGGHIEVSAALDGADLVLTVRDDGQGIAPERLETIFTMFERGGASTGLGIGLALVKQIATMHGGTLHVSSEGANQGSTFAMRIPGAETGAPAHVPASSPAHAGNGESLRVLVVDDNVDLVDSLSTVLGFLGEEVRTAASGEEALARMQEWAPAVVLMDVGMPGMSGYEAASRARAQPWGREPVLVAMTGWGRDEDRARALAAGFDRHVVKPLDLESLRSLLSELRATRHA